MAVAARPPKTWRMSPNKPLLWAHKTPAADQLQNKIIPTATTRLCFIFMIAVLLIIGPLVLNQEATSGTRSRSLAPKRHTGTGVPLNHCNLLVDSQRAGI